MLVCYILLMIFVPCWGFVDWFHWKKPLTYGGIEIPRVDTWKEQEFGPEFHHKNEYDTYFWSLWGGWSICACTRDKYGYSLRQRRCFGTTKDIRNKEWIRSISPIYWNAKAIEKDVGVIPDPPSVTLNGTLVLSPFQRHSTSCSGRFLRVKGCGPCANGIWGHWTPWTWICSVTCGKGEYIRTRKCISGTCSKKEAHESRSCQLHPCGSLRGWGQWAWPKVLDDPLYYPDWKLATVCSAHCDGGVRLRLRTCLDPIPCNGKSRENVKCNTHSCPEYEKWGAWGKCTGPCGTQTRTRGCKYGDNCRGRMKENRKCNTDACPKLWGTWGSWSRCQSSCGPGKEIRKRRCIQNGQPVKSRLFGFSPNAGLCSKIPGDDMEMKECNLKPCYCWSDWHPWAACQPIGNKTRTRSCLYDGKPLIGIHYNGGCPTLQGKEIDTDRCNYTKPSWKEWSNWSKCTVTCGNGTIIRTRACVNEGGARENPSNCERIDGYSDKIVKTCSMTACEFTKWGRFSLCSGHCGTKTRTRNCLRSTCDGSRRETERCHKDVCSKLTMRVLGCWKDKGHKRAIPHLANYNTSVEDCAAHAARLGYTVFAVQYGGQCYSGPYAKQTYKTYGPSNDCHDDGKGGTFANEVYEIVYEVLHNAGCWKDKIDNRSIPHLANYNRSNSVHDCANHAKSLGYKVFAVQYGGECYSGPSAKQTYKIHGASDVCRREKDGTGGFLANQVYRIVNVVLNNLGCWQDRGRKRAIPYLADYYRSNSVLVCANHAKRLGYRVFAVQYGGQCYSGPFAKQTYKKHGVSNECNDDGKGGSFANQVYEISYE